MWLDHGSACRHWIDFILFVLTTNHFASKSIMLLNLYLIRPQPYIKTAWPTFDVTQPREGAIWLRDISHGIGGLWLICFFHIYVDSIVEF